MRAEDEVGTVAKRRLRNKERTKRDTDEEGTLVKKTKTREELKGTIEN